MQMLRRWKQLTPGCRYLSPNTKRVYRSKAVSGTLDLCRYLSTLTNLELCSLIASKHNQIKQIKAITIVSSCGIPVHSLAVLASCLPMSHRFVRQGEHLTALRHLVRKGASNSWGPGKVLMFWSITECPEFSREVTLDSNVGSVDLLGPDVSSLCDPSPSLA